MRILVVEFHVVSMFHPSSALLSKEKFIKNLIRQRDVRGKFKLCQIRRLQKQIKADFHLNLNQQLATNSSN